MKIKDISCGKRFGKLTVVSFHGRTCNHRALFLVKCDCGKSKIMRGQAILFAKGCGCTRGPSRATHNHSQSNGGNPTGEYTSWAGMKERCLNRKSKKYKQYGGRGIKVCERWLRFDNFLADMGKKPTSRHSIGRIDNNGDYKPSNCRWETPIQQANNKTNSRFINFKGRAKTISQWARITKIKMGTIFYRIGSGWSIEDALTK